MGPWSVSRQAVEILYGAGGGSSSYSDTPIQRIFRDVRAVSQHALMNPDTNAELYGRVLYVLDPGTLYI